MADGGLVARHFFNGGVAEWPKAAVLKTAEVKASGGSNPSPSANLFSDLPRPMKEDSQPEQRDLQTECKRPANLGPRIAPRQLPPERTFSNSRYLGRSGGGAVEMVLPSMVEGSLGSELGT